MNKPKLKRRLSPFQIIILGFASVILAGALLLMLPISSSDGSVTPFDQTLFTSTSAVCVTGLIVRDTATHWSVFGQSLILLMIQVGGLGVVTVAASFALLSGRKISLMQRSTMQEAMSAQKVGGIVRLTGFILRGTFIIELVGAVALMPAFCKDHGFKGIWMAFFHSISSFCNAGFDILGTEDAKYQSLSAYASNPLVVIVISLLIIVGGIGFLTWDDIKTHRHHLSRYRMQSKVILVTSLVLTVIPFVFYFIFEYSDASLSDRIMYSVFQAITPRTAGFNTTDLSALSSSGKVIMITLMLIGGSPGSTAGGMKTTTIAVLFSLAFSVFRKKEDASFFNRRLGIEAIKSAATIFILYLTLFITSGVAISTIEGLPVDVCLFETASAIGTVGLTLGLTPSLSLASHIILMMLMFFGRVGGLTLIYATMTKNVKNLSKLPQEKITVG